MTLARLQPLECLKIKNNRKKQTHTNTSKKTAQDRRTSMAKKGTGKKEEGASVILSKGLDKEPGL